MSNFTASNGIPVTCAVDGPRGEMLLTYQPDHTYPFTNARGDDVQALREFFQAEADERLGRWRWPENLNYVVYPFPEWPDSVRVVDEKTGHSNHFSRARAYAVTLSEKPFPQVARAYFDAHPESKPWHDAAPAEVWDVDLPSGGMRAVTVYSARHDEPVTVVRDAHTQVEVETDDPTIRDARRIYPEVF